MISEAALERMLEADRRSSGARGDRAGRRRTGRESGIPPRSDHSRGRLADDEISRTELFGPVTLLYRVSSLDEAIALVNDSPYGLTAAVHTASLHRAMRFAERVQAGVVVVNGGTHGSEPHMGFGGVKNSGTGWREAGIEALDVYSDWKIVNLIADPALA